MESGVLAELPDVRRGPCGLLTPPPPPVTSKVNPPLPPPVGWLGSRGEGSNKWGGSDKALVSLPIMILSTFSPDLAWGPKGGGSIQRGRSLGWVEMRLGGDYYAPGGITKYTLFIAPSRFSALFDFSVKLLFTA